MRKARTIFYAVKRLASLVKSGIKWFENCTPWCTKTPNEKLGVFAFSGMANLLANADRLSVQSDDKFDLDAFDSKDPDGDNLSYLWMYYPEVGTYQGKINMGAENVHGVYLRAPEVIKAKTMHLILKLSDKGEPSLTRYKRIIVTVLPK